MSEKMLHDVDYLRERADVSYEEALDVLQRNDGDVMRALVELEQQGRVHGASETGGTQGEAQRQAHCDVNDAKEKATSFFKRACQTRLVIERKREDGEKETIANLSAPFAIGVTILAPYITLGSAALTLASGYQVKVKKEEK